MDGSESSGAAGPPQVVMETNLGTIVIELDEELAPITTANFLAYVNVGFYDGSDGLGATTFHRVVPGFVIQGGGLTEDLSTKATMPPIVNESSNGLSNLRGTLSMARTMDPDSATSQFFINLVDNTGLDTPPGYAVFGQVVEGIEVVDAIAAVPTTTMGPYMDVPVDPVIITSATVQ
ncbi:MAG: peptidyl-prolyl cis-trans isomerase [Myxococcales bacterium]|nr:peptidyl-prolyl cis-trans isomerase [Myxococcales bacterium]